MSKIPGLTVADLVSISAACAHVAAMITFNVAERPLRHRIRKCRLLPKLSAIKESKRKYCHVVWCGIHYTTIMSKKVKENIVTLCGVEYTTTMSQVCFSLCVLASGTVLLLHAMSVQEHKILL
jgi:hypothetical protein